MNQQERQLKGNKGNVPFEKHFSREHNSTAESLYGSVWEYICMMTFPSSCDNYRLLLIFSAS